MQNLRFLLPSMVAALGAFPLAKADSVGLKENKPIKEVKDHPCTRQKTFVSDCPELVIFSGNSNKKLADSVVKYLHRGLGKANISRFNDGEVRVEILEPVRGKDVYLIQPTSPPVNDNLMELLLTVSALKLANAKRVTVIVPYFGYVRSVPTSRAGTHTSSSKVTLTRRGSNSFEQDKQTPVKNKEGLTSMYASSDVARMMEVVGADRVLVVDMQTAVANFAKGLFRKAQVEYIETSEVMVESVYDHLGLDEQIKAGKRLVLVAPHAACVPKAHRFRQNLYKLLQKKGYDPSTVDIGLATIIRTPQRKLNSEDKSEKIVECVGNVKDSVALIVEDIVDTGKTTIRAAESLHACGADKIYAFATHAILGGKAPENLQQSHLDKIIVLDTVPIPQSKLDKIPKMAPISIAPVLADAIHYLHYEPKTKFKTK